MGLTTSLTHAVSGLRSIETGLETVARNVANAGVEGYARRKVSPVELSTGQVIAADVQRELDVVVQRHLRAETGAAAYTEARASTLARLDEAAGVPGGAGSLDTLLGGFAAALQGLAAEPANGALRRDVASAAQSLAGGLNRFAGDVETLRRDADTALGEAVSAANAALQTLQGIEKDLSHTRGGNARADMLDVRDRALDTLASLIDVRISPRGDGQVAVYTAGGDALYTGVASRLTFETGTGAVTVTGPEGEAAALDLSRQRSGRVAALISLRDATLPQVARGVDSIAAGLAEAANAAGVSVFVDAGNGVAASAYAGGAQEAGFAARIAVDPNLLRDPSRLSAGGSPATPRALLAALEAPRTFAAVDGNAEPTGSVAEGLRHLLDRQGAMAADAGRVHEGQVSVLNGLRERFAEGSGVSVDQAMAQLVALQSAYAANARIIAVVQEMYDALLRI